MDHESGEKRKKHASHLEKPTARQFLFAQLVAKGHTQVEAYRRIYNPKAKPKHAEQAACRIAALPAVAREIAKVRSKTQAKTILSIDDRLAIAAECAQDETAPWGERLDGLRTYNKTAGDHAPERTVTEIVGAGGGPLQVAATAVLGTMTRREKVAAWREARRAARATQAQPAAPA